MCAGLFFRSIIQRLNLIYPPRWSTRAIQGVDGISRIDGGAGFNPKTHDEEIYRLAPRSQGIELNSVRRRELRAAGDSQNPMKRRDRRD
jgi:hypothetical protein